MSTTSASPVTRYLQLGLCVGGIYTCYLLYGVLQERLYQEQPDGTVFAATVSGGTVQLLACKRAKALRSSEHALPTLFARPSCSWCNVSLTSSFLWFLTSLPLGHWPC